MLQSSKIINHMGSNREKFNNANAIFRNVKFYSAPELILHFGSTNIFLSIIDELNSEIIP